MRTFRKLATVFWENRETFPVPNWGLLTSHALVLLRVARETVVLVRVEPTWTAPGNLGGSDSWEDAGMNAKDVWVANDEGSEIVRVRDIAAATLDYAAA